MYREPKSLFSYAVPSTEWTIILKMIFKLISLCSYRDCICFELQLIGSYKSSICCVVHLSVQLFSAQKWCMCLPWALWGSHSLLSCVHAVWAAQVFSLVDKSQVPLALTFPCCCILWALGADGLMDGSCAIPGLQERLWSLISSTYIFQKQHSQEVF